MSISEEELKKRLLNAGNKLLSPPPPPPPPSVTVLLDSLDLLENLLAVVEQSPSESMKEALMPATEALVTDELLKHSDTDVRVAVASCISDITRITAPDAPYADDKMKEVFQLIVSSFEKLDDRSSRSYTKRFSILETVAKVRSCVVMLDLECDDLIVEMFQHFFRTIRDDHLDGVFSSMETIMTLVIEESETISIVLLSSMLDVLKKDNKDVLPIARQLGENVVVKCASKLQKYILQAMRSRGTSLDDYSKVVADVYQAGNEPFNTNLADDNVLINPSSAKAAEVSMETQKVASPSEEVGSTLMSNGILQKGNVDSSATNGNSKVADLDTQDDKMEQSKATADSLKPQKSLKSKKKPKKSTKRKKKKTNFSKSSIKPLEPVESNRETEVIDTPELQDDAGDAGKIQTRNLAVDNPDNSGNEKSSDALISPPETSHSKCADISPPSPSGSLADDTNSKNPGEGKSKDCPVEEGEKADVGPVKESDTNRDPDEATGSKSTLNMRSASASDQEETVLGSADDKRTEDDTLHKLDDNLAKDMTQETQVSSQLPDKKKIGHEKVTPAKELKKTPAKEEKEKAVVLPRSISKATKDESNLEKALKSNSKRKHPSEEKASETQASGGNLVGATVEVWWPVDKKYYQGVIESFDAAKKKHKILYCDGDIEVLNLQKERWQLICDSEGHAKDGENADESADETPKGKKAKVSPSLGAKQGKTGSPAKKSGASVSKSKATTKSGSKEESSKKASKSGGKGSKSKASKSVKISKPAKKIIDDEDDGDSDTLKSISKSKGKLSKSVGKSNSSATGKVKAGASTKDEDTEEESPEPSRTPEKSKSKSKSQSTPKSKKISKKRKRSLKA